MSRDGEIISAIEAALDLCEDDQQRVRTLLFVWQRALEREQGRFEDGGGAPRGVWPPPGFVPPPPPWPPYQRSGPYPPPYYVPQVPYWPPPGFVPPPPPWPPHQAPPPAPPPPPPPVDAQPAGWGPMPAPAGATPAGWAPAGWRPSPRGEAVVTPDNGAPSQFTTGEPRRLP